MTLVASIVLASARISGGWMSRSGGVQGLATGLKKFRKIQHHQLVGVTPRRTVGRYSKGLMPRVKRGGSVLQKATNPARV